MNSTPVRLGDQIFSPVDLAATTFRRIAEEASRYLGRPPSVIALTYPATWSPASVSRLVDAAARAGLHQPLLIAEPVAAALYHATTQQSRDIEPGEYVGVYDLGAGTFDATILRRTTEGFEIWGPPGALPNFGDDMRGALVAAGRTGDPFEGGAQVETAIEPILAVTVEEFRRTVESAGLRMTDLVAVYLIGGWSRVPGVEQAIAQRIGRPLVPAGEPETVVCLGAYAAIVGDLPAEPSRPAVPARRAAYHPGALHYAASPPRSVDPRPDPTEGSSPVPPLYRYTGTGQPGDSDPGRRPPGRSDIRPLLVVLAAVVTVAVVAVVVLVANRRSDQQLAGPEQSDSMVPAVTAWSSGNSSGAGSPALTGGSPSSVQSAQPTGTALLGPAEQSLVVAVNQARIDSPTCAKVDSGVAGATAAVSCDAVPELDYQLGLIRFKDLATLRGYFGQLDRNVTDQDGNCREGTPYSGTWRQSGARVGQLICFTAADQDGGLFWICWSFEDQLIAAVIVHGSATEAGAWWSSSAQILG